MMWAAVLVVLLAGPQAPAAAPGVAPAETIATGTQRYVVTDVVHQIREFRRLEDGIVGGDSEAYLKRQLVGRELAERLLAQPAEVWRLRQNALALIGFVLMGGEARVLRETLRRAAFEEGLQDLSLGVLALGEARPTEARQRLAKVDPEPLPLDLRNALQLAQISLTAQENPELAADRLEELRVRSRGTLIDESASRQQVFLQLRLYNLERAIALAARYFARFPHSHFAESFANELGAAVGSEDWPSMIDVVAIARRELELDNRVHAARVFVAIAREAVLRGFWRRGAEAADVAMSLAGANEELHRRSQVYRLAALVGTGDAGPVLPQLEGLARSELASEDRGIVMAAINVKRQLDWPIGGARRVDTEGGASGRGQQAVATASGGAAEISAKPNLGEVHERGRRTLAKADQELTRSGPND